MQCGKQKAGINWIKEIIQLFQRFEAPSLSMKDAIGYILLLREWGMSLSSGDILFIFGNWGVGQ